MKIMDWDMILTHENYEEISETNKRYYAPQHSYKVRNGVVQLERGYVKTDVDLEMFVKKFEGNWNIISVFMYGKWYDVNNLIDY